MKLIASLLCVLGFFSPARETKPSVIPGQDRDAVEALVPLLGAEDIATREEATGKLLEMGRDILPRLVSAVRRSSDWEIKGRLRFLIGELRGVRAELRFERTTISAGERFRWRVHLVNDRSLPVILVRALPGSDTYRQYPFVDLEVRLPDGRMKSGQDFQYERSGHIDPPGVEDMVEVRPGVSLNPFRERCSFGGNGLWFDHRPPEPGNYRVRFVYDSTPKDWSLWTADEPVDLESGKLKERARASRELIRDENPERRARFSRLHHARIVSDWIDLRVEVR